MPLVVLCGFPSSGKTKIAWKLKKVLENEKSHVEVILIDDGSIDRNKIYSDRKLEILTRSTLKSSVERSLTNSNVVIVDSLNYVKGFRYELHCVAKYARSTHCVIHCDISLDEAVTFNQQKIAQDQYFDDVLKALISRFEEPNSMNRWDSPLFTIQTTDDVPFNEIFLALFEKRKPAPNMSTQNPPLMSPSFVHEVDTTLQMIAGAIIAGQKSSMIGDSILIPGVSESYTIKQKLSLAEIRRKRKEFLTYLRANPVADVSQVSKTFLCFLST